MVRRAVISLRQPLLDALEGGYVFRVEREDETVSKAHFGPEHVESLRTNLVPNVDAAKRVARLRR